MVKSSKLNTLARQLKNSETIVGVLCKDGVVLGSEKLLVSKMLVENTNKKIYNIDTHSGMVISGRAPDGRNIVHRARQEAEQYHQYYGIDVGGNILADRVSQYVHAHTLYPVYRPFGSAVIMGSYDTFDGYTLYMIEPSGQYFGYYGCAAGKGKQTAKSELDKRNFKDMTCKEALFHVAKMLHLSHEEFKDKKYELEITWICDATNQKHEKIPKDLQAEIEKQALESIEQDQMGGAQ